MWGGIGDGIGARVSAPEYSEWCALLVGPTSLLGAGEVAINTLTPGAGYVVVVEVAVAPGERATFREAFAAFRAVRARQAGFRGTIEFATGEGRSLLMVFWDRPEDQQRAAQDPAMQQGWPRVVATLATPPAFLASGTITRNSICAGVTSRQRRKGVGDVGWPR